MAHFRYGRVAHHFRGASLLAVASMFAFFCSAGCSQDPSEKPAPPEGVGQEIRDTAAPAGDADVSEHLLAMGYVDFDENADPDLSGVVVHAPQRVSPGWNLYTNDVDTVILMDAGGAVRREWTIPGMKHCEHVEVLDGLRLAVVCEAEALVVLEANGRTVFHLPADVHHDVAQRSDGSLLVLARDDRRLYRGRLLQFDGLLEVSPEGEARWVWRGSEAVDALRALHGPGELDAWAPLRAMAKLGWGWLTGASIRRHEYYHINTVEVLPENALAAVDERFRAGNVLVGLRNANAAVILDRDTWRPVWHWGEDVTDLPHTPTLLENGRLLVFDNGARRKYTRILEVEPRSKAVVWQYPERPDRDFFSEYQGSVQRLPNGNTLICLSERGRVVEIDAGGEIVWEFWNPELTDEGRKGIYRFTRLAPDVGARLLAAGG